MSVAAVVLAYGPEPLLEECVAALLASRDVDVEVVLVDNGCTSNAVDLLEPRDGVSVIRPGRNTGFAGGCNLGVASSSSTHVALVNGDAVVDPDALARLVAALSDTTIGMASADLRLHQAPGTMNSAGNPVHFLGLSWAGALGEPATAHGVGTDVASASGAAVALRRETWDLLGGFWEAMFAYCEDAELSLRCWQSGLRVRFVPGAVVRHRYEFSRNSTKLHLLERNRLLLLLTLLERRTLALVLPAAIALEVAVLVVAVSQGWGRDKARGWWWILRNHRVVRRRRREVQAARVVRDADLLPGLLTGTFAPGGASGFSAPAALNAGSSLYWAGVRRSLGRTATTSGGAARTPGP